MFTKFSIKNIKNCFFYNEKTKKKWPLLNAENPSTNKTQVKISCDAPR